MSSMKSDPPTSSKPSEGYSLLYYAAGFVMVVTLSILLSCAMPASDNSVLYGLYGWALVYLLIAWLFLWPVVAVSCHPRLHGWAARRFPRFKRHFEPHDDGKIGALLRRPLHWLWAFVLAMAATGVCYALTLVHFSTAAAAKRPHTYEAVAFAEKQGLDLNEVVDGLNVAREKAKEEKVELTGQAKVFMTKYLSLPEDMTLTNDPGNCDNSDWCLLISYFDAQRVQGAGTADKEERALNSFDALVDKVIVPLVGRWMPKANLNPQLGQRIRKLLHDRLISTQPFVGSSDSPQKILQAILFDARHTARVTENEGNPGSIPSLVIDSPAAVLMVETMILRHKEEMAPYHRATEMMASGAIQPLTIWLFFFALALLHGRGRIAAAATKRNGGKSYSELLAERIHIAGRGASPKGVVAEAESRLDRIEYKSVEYLVWAIPSLGFIGTVVGVGAALGNADKVVKAASKTEQADAITAVTSVLGVAFDTTLVALVCLIPVMLLASRRRRVESQTLADVLHTPPAPKPPSPALAAGGLQ